MAVCPYLFITLALRVLCANGEELLLKKHESIATKDFKFFNPEEPRRKISMSVNSGCIFNNCTLPNGLRVSIVNTTVSRDENCDSDDRPEDEQHWLWSVIGRPAVQTAVTKPGNNIVVKWHEIFGMGDIGKTISYEEEPIFTGAIMLMNLIEFEDTNNTAVMDDSPREPVVYPLVKFHWIRTVIEDTDERIAIQFIGHNFTKDDNETRLHGAINMTMSGYSIEGFGRWLPHLSHDFRTNQVDIQLDHINTTSGFKHSRFALEMYVVSDASPNSTLIRQTTTTLDDEHTPGIFRTEELILPGMKDSSDLGKTYLQWRPVVYTTPVRDLSESTSVFVNRSVRVENPAQELNGSLLYALYGHDLDAMMVRKFNVTLGAPGDGYYKKTHFQAWTFTFGIGEPIRNGLSPVIIIATAAMLGTIFIVSLIGCAICGLNKWSRRNGARYTRVDMQND